MRNLPSLLIGVIGSTILIYELGVVVMIGVVLLILSYDLLDVRSSEDTK